MIFKMGPYLDKFRADCKDKGVWRLDTTYQECFNGLGFSSYKYCGYEGGNWLPHYLSDEEFVIFALRYGG